MNALVHASCALLPPDALARLGPFRARDDLRLVREGGRLWVFWPAGDAELARALLALPGAELLAERDGLWYRPGAHLPSFGVPDPRRRGVALPALLSPEPVAPAGPPGGVAPVKVRFVRDATPRPASALRLPLAELARWADRATSFAFEGLMAARRGEEVLLYGKLPPLAGERFWGKRVLVPAGYRPEPDLPGAVLAQALALPPGDLALATLSGEVEVVPRAAFGPLTRAGVRLAVQQGGRP